MLAASVDKLKCDLSAPSSSSLSSSSSTVVTVATAAVTVPSSSSLSTCRTLKVSSSLCFCFSTELLAKNMYECTLLQLPTRRYFHVCALDFIFITFYYCVHFSSLLNTLY